MLQSSLLRAALAPGWVPAEQEPRAPSHEGGGRFGRPARDTPGGKLPVSRHTQLRIPHRLFSIAQEGSHLELLFTAA